MEFIESLKAAHHELMEQTGWGDMLANMTSLAYAAPQYARSLVQEAQLFRYAVNWGEPFFKVLLAFHVLVAGVVLYLVFWRWQPAPTPATAGRTRAMELATSRAEEKLFALSVVLVVLSLSAYPLNRLGARYGHHLFVEPGVNYFDDNVLFIGVVYWFPLVLLSLLVQLKLFFNVMRLMVLAKSAQFKAQQRASDGQRAKAEGGAKEGDGDKGADHAKKRD